MRPSLPAPLTILAIISLLLSGCLAVNPTAPRQAAAPRYQTYVLRLFEREPAYRNDHKVCTRFALPFRPLEVGRINLSLEAYNDDPRYSRTVWLEIDGIGGYLGAERVQRSQYTGSGVLGTKARKHFIIDMHDVPISVKGKAPSRINFEELLKQTGLHTLCTWISTYGKFGPESWISLDLEIEATRPPVKNAHTIQETWYQGNEQGTRRTRPLNFLYQQGH